MSGRPRPAERMRGMAAYRAQGVPRPGLLRLDGSAGATPREYPSDVMAHVHDYPDVSALAEAIASRIGVTAERIVIGAGADELLDRCCRGYLERGRTMVLPRPTFAMLPHYAALAEGTIVSVEWPGETFPTGPVIEAIDERTAIVVCISPNNPTGAVLSARDLERVSAAARHALVVLDHAYIEYAEEDDLTEMAAALPNAVVVRTLSKAWGLAGARVGWAIAPAGVADTLRAAGGPYSVAGPSLAIALHRWQTAAPEVARHVARVRAYRERLNDTFAAYGLDVARSRANFVTVDPGNRAPFLFDALLAQGVLVRTIATPGGSQLRFAVPDGREERDRLSAALARILAPQALLLDMDGVLADVSDSQRLCIRRTADAFGVSVDADEVSEVVLAGNANDDWQVTQRLLARRGREVPLRDVRERYQSMYLGDRSTPGLRERERLLVEPGLIARLGRRLPIAVVTGRPRDEAEWFLEAHGLDTSIATLVCAEDAPRKPDPAPVQLAMQRLGVRRAWMIGDTPDDVASARAAGVLAVGVASPADDPALARQRLMDAGAAFMLERWEDLEQWMP